MSEKAATRGRPRKFDRKEVLEAALGTFRRNGYSGTSLEDLTKVTGLNRPSLYGTFGNKRELYEAAIDMYWTRTAAYAGSGLWETGHFETDLRLFFARFLDAFSEEEPGGCVLACSLPADVDRDAGLQQKFEEIFAQADASIAARLKKAQTNGEIAETDIHALSQLIVSTLFGLSVRSRAGATRPQLEAMTEALCVLLTKSKPPKLEGSDLGE